MLWVQLCATAEKDRLHLQQSLLYLVSDLGSSINTKLDKYPSGVCGGAEYTTARRQFPLPTNALLHTYSATLPSLHVPCTVCTVCTYVPT